MMTIYRSSFWIEEVLEKLVETGVVYGKLEDFG